jgi:SulP family sulfate permease
MATLTWAGSLDKQGVKIVGFIPAKLPEFQLPQVDWAQVHTLAGSSFAIALLGLLEAISMAKVIVARTGQKKLDLNQQCFSEGVANLAGSVFQCFPGSGSLTRSTISQQAGARTQWASVISAVAVALTVVLFAQFAYYIPRSALAGILIRSAWRLVDRKQAAYFLRSTRGDACIVAVTALSAVVVSVEFCVLIGVLMSFILYIPKAARVHLTELTLSPQRVVRERLADDPPCGRIRIFSLEGDFFFGAAVELEKHLEAIASAAKGQVRVIVLRLKRIRNPDGVCMQVLDRFIEELHQSGVTVLMCAVRPDLMKIIDASGLAQRLGLERVFVFQDNREVWSSTLDAIRFAYEIIQDDVCDTCPRHAESLNKKEGWTYLI